MSPTEAVLLIGVASWRIWRLLARDDITEWTRRRLHGWPLTLVDCPWCLGTWIALAVTFTVDALHPLPAPWLIAAASAGLVGLLEVITERIGES